MTRRRDTLTDAEVIGSVAVDVQVPAVPRTDPPSPEQCRRATRLVAGRCRDSADARVLLAMLGLLP